LASILALRPFVAGAVLGTLVATSVFGFWNRNEPCALKLAVTPTSANFKVTRFGVTATSSLRGEGEKRIDLVEVDLDRVKRERLGAMMRGENTETERERPKKFMLVGAESTSLVLFLPANPSSVIYYRIVATRRMFA
jgi:hypothetical protein